MLIKEISRNVHVLDKPLASGEKFTTFFLSDIHFDSPYSNRTLLKKHLDHLKETGGGIFINGDWFDLMQGRYDPRRSYTDILPQYKGDSYIDLVISDSVEFLLPYADNIIGIGMGNHCTSVLKHCGTNAVERLITLLNMKAGTSIRLGGYSGWIIFKFSIATDGSCVRTKRIKYHHGARANARRSKGILSVDIDAAKWPDADIIIKGDDHMKWYYPSMVRQRIDKNFNIYKDVQHHIRLGSYLDGLADSYGGWPVEKDFQECKMGGWYVTFTSKKINQKQGVEIQVNEAI